MKDLRFPVGRFSAPPEITAKDRERFIEELERMPEHLRRAISGLSDEQLDTPYRPEGWTVRQLVHHIADSHMNAYIRFKLALTEDEPTIKTYLEDRWARLADTEETPIEVSLTLLEALHVRCINLLRSLSDADFARTLQHPENGLMTVGGLLALYAWHGRHHVAHITSLRERMGWS